MSLRDTGRGHAPKTSKVQIPALFKQVCRDPRFGWVPGTVNLDVGGGAHELGTQYLEGLGVENLVFDPQRSAAHQARVLARLDVRPADTGTITNVLNVIDTAADRHLVLAFAAAHVMPGAPVYVSIHEGNGSGVGGATDAKGGVDRWQANRSTVSYLPEVRAVFPHAERCGDVIIAQTSAPASWAPCARPKNARVWRPARACATTLKSRDCRCPACTAHREAHPVLPLTEAVNALRWGKPQQDAVYVHVSALDHLPPIMRDATAEALRIAGRSLRDVDVLKFARREPAVSLMVYPDFDADPFPATGGFVKVDLATGQTTVRGPTQNPTILHRKEEMLWPEDPRVPAWARFTQALERGDAFGHSLDKVRRKALLSRIGRRDPWNARLESMGLGRYLARWDAPAPAHRRARARH